MKSVVPYLQSIRPIADKLGSTFDKWLIDAHHSPI
jgi:hypothetical protein